MNKPKNAGMKSAYDLAMARLDKSEGTSKPLTAAQKAEIAEIDKKCQAEIAQVEIMAKQHLADARAKGDGEEIRKIADERVRAIERARSHADEDKARVRGG
ncbi:MAG TPA: hypothetical protein VIH35_04675 [Kiritimatiellia bacterium]|jgi:hypothetical protein